MQWKISICFLFLFVACKERSSEGNVENTSNPNEVIIPEDFPDFYNKFHSDSVYQLEHIVFPLEGTPTGGKWKKEDWVIHKPIQGRPGEYVQSFDNFQDIMVENIRDSLGIFRMERRYSKMSGEWNLIYYKLKTKVFD